MKNIFTDSVLSEQLKSDVYRLWLALQHPRRKCSHYLRAVPITVLRGDHCSSERYEISVEICVEICRYGLIPLHIIPLGPHVCHCLLYLASQNTTYLHIKYVFVLCTDVPRALTDFSADATFIGILKLESKECASGELDPGLGSPVLRGLG